MDDQSWRGKAGRWLLQVGSRKPVAPLVSLMAPKRRRNRSEHRLGKHSNMKDKCGGCCRMLLPIVKHRISMNADALNVER
jgi:hypothetical protein